MGGPWRLLRALRLRLLGPEKEHVGSDQFGNKYYKIPKHQTWAGQTIPEKRIIEAVNQEEYKYEVGDLPTEWEDLNMFSTALIFDSSDKILFELGLEKEERIHPQWRHPRMRGRGSRYPATPLQRMAQAMEDCHSNSFDL
ncbi:NADH dehydrogenase [ubiquinone] 1 alpha subcomplex assembly factor 2 isoform X2 [Lepidochelys kempii]|uniref:NADH dehydrogenase [ubiquinone] 1 alpha subcomplex assembly factor 2 isoform X2 n=1 Tax=Lepidochelys kempii TaxID=8472 RepID=UPI003C6F17BD